MAWVDSDTPEQLRERVDKIIESHIPDVLVICAVCDKAIDPGQSSVPTIKGPIHGFPKRCVYRLK